MREDLTWGIRWGVSLAIVFSLFVVLTRLARKPYPTSEVAALVLMYLVTGVVGGAVVGWLRPMNTTRLGKAFIGGVTAVPVSMAILVYLVGSPMHWTIHNWLTVVVYAVIVGPIFALFSFPDV